MGRTFNETVDADDITTPGSIYYSGSRNDVAVIVSRGEERVPRKRNVVTLKCRLPTAAEVEDNNVKRKAHGLLPWTTEARRVEMCKAVEAIRKRAHTEI